MIIIYENNFFKLSFHLEMPLKNFLVARFFCQTTFLFYLCSLHSYSSSCSLLIRLLSFSIPMNSMEIEPPLVKKGLTVHQNCLLAISFSVYLWSNGQVVKALDSQFRGSGFKTTG